MKDLKNGFTLMETLIALGVAGVIAAVLVPQLVKNIEKEKAGPALARTVEQIELGIQNYIQDENDKITDGSYISRISEIDDFSLAKLAPYIGLTRNNTTYDPGNIKEYAYIYDSVFIPTAHAAMTGVQSAQTDDYILDFDAGLKGVPNGEVNYPDRGNTLPQNFSVNKGGCGTGGGAERGTTTSSGGSTPSTPSTPSVTPTLPETPKTPTITPITPTPRPEITPVIPSSSSSTSSSTSSSGGSTSSTSSSSTSSSSTSSGGSKPSTSSSSSSSTSSSTSSSGGIFTGTIEDAEDGLDWGTSSSSSSGGSTSSSGGSKPSTSSSSTSSSSTSSGGSKPSTSSSSTSSSTSSSSSSSSSSGGTNVTIEQPRVWGPSDGSSSSSSSSTSSSGGVKVTIEQPEIWGPYDDSTTSSSSSTSSSGGSTSSTSSSTSSTSSSSSSGGVTPTPPKKPIIPSILPDIPFWPSSSSSSTSSTSSSTSSTSSSSSSGGSTSSSGGSTSSTSSSSSSTSSSGGNDTYTSNKSPVDVVFETPLEIGEIRDIVAKSSEADPIIGTFVVDVNGVEHKPNMYGKDTFVFNLRNSGKVSPYGLDKFASACQDGNITDGKACTARVVSDGYKIKY